MLRTRYRYGTLLCDEPSGINCCSNDLLLATWNDFRDEAKFEGFGCSERASGVCEFAGKRLIPYGLGKASEGTDVGS